jgi:hypothetical protein
MLDLKLKNNNSNIYLIISIYLIFKENYYYYNILSFLNKIVRNYYK